MPAGRLLLFAPNLSGGGAERTLARLATHWAEHNRDVTLVTLAARSPQDFSVSPKVRHVGLGLAGEAVGPFGGVRSNLRRVRRLRSEIVGSRPDVVVSFIEQANVVALLAARSVGVPVVISERTDPARHPVGTIWNWLRRRTYPRTTALVVLTEEIASSMQSVVRGRPIAVIPNGVAAPGIVRHLDSTILLGVGRLERAKGFDRLIEAFGRISDRHPDWKLVLVGEGPQRAELESMIAEGGLAGRVRLAGHVREPSSWFARAGLFALPSRYEGFPNALLEAMAHGVPVVAFDGPAAVRQIVRHETDGLLVPRDDVAGFTEALGDMMSDAARRARMGEAAREVVRQFSLDDFFARWDAVIDAAAAGGPQGKFATSSLADASGDQARCSGEKS